MDHEPVGSLLYGALLLIATSTVVTLHFAFRLAGDAGVSRFLEKYPAAHRYAFWTRRWPNLCASLLFLWAAFFIASLTFLIPLLSADALPQTLLRWALMVVVGLLALHILPMSLAESYADRITIVFLPLVTVWTAILYPLTWLIAGMEHGLTHLLLSQSHDENRPSSEDEIISVVDHADADDLEESEREMIRSILEFGDTVTREIMTHRVDIVAFEHTATIEACVERSKQSAFSRFPVYANSLDDVRGFVHVKDLLRALSEGGAGKAIAGYCNKATFVPESMPIDDLFRLMRTARTQVALVVDEYGGTAGLVSMEDIIEELVGEIHDEYDTTESAVVTLPDGSWLVDARESVEEINEKLDISIPESDDYDSVGGFIFDRLGHIPGPGAELEEDAFMIRVQTAVPHRIINVRIARKFLPNTKE